MFFFLNTRLIKIIKLLNQSDGAQRLTLYDILIKFQPKNAHFLLSGFDKRQSRKTFLIQLTPNFYGLFVNELDSKLYRIKAKCSINTR